jgi:hypothetical protein
MAMDKVYKSNDSECYAQSSETFRIFIHIVNIGIFLVYWTLPDSSAQFIASGLKKSFEQIARALSEIYIFLCDLSILLMNEHTCR